MRFPDPRRHQLTVEKVVPGHDRKLPRLTTVVPTGSKHRPGASRDTHGIDTGITVPVKRHRGEPGHTGHTGAHRHTDHTDEPHNHPNPPIHPHERTTSQYRLARGVGLVRRFVNRVCPGSPLCFLTSGSKTVGNGKSEVRWGFQSTIVAPKAFKFQQARTYTSTVGMLHRTGRRACSCKRPTGRLRRR